MTWLTKSLLTLTLLTTGSLSTAQADTYEHIDQLALRIAGNARRLIPETRHYRHTHEYRHLLSDARDLERLADHLHELAHHHGSLHHMQADVASLDRRFHHLEDLIESIERHSRHGHGHVHGHTEHVWSLLHAIEDDLHHLQEDLRTLSGTARHHSGRIVVPQPIIVDPPVVHPHVDSHRSRWGGYNPGFDRHRFDAHSFDRHRFDRGHDVRRGRRSFSIGGGSSRITFGF
ncbi:hypothetical protein [Roseimaritima sediminicola]|uniref:hypothetical protein n=1 Tax=Roseimaritima sediminicola TaxID=2662066 RepID=UPI0012984977|nr:hypothetical protein [Roseimaritima sediminicola]